MARTCSRSALLAVMILAIVSLPAVGGVAAEGGTLSVAQDDPTTAMTSEPTETVTEPRTARTLEATTSVSGSTTSRFGPEGLFTILQSYRGIIGLFAGLLIGIIGTTAYSRTRGTLATVDQNLSMVRRGTREEPDRRPRSPLTVRGFQLWWSRRFGVQADKTAKDLAELFTDDAIGNQIVASTHQEYGGSETADGPIQQLEEIRSNKQTTAEEIKANVTEIEPKGRSPPEQPTGVDGGNQQGNRDQTPQDDYNREDFSTICAYVRDKVNAHTGFTGELLDAIDPTTSVAAGTVEVRLVEGLEKINEYERLEHQLSTGNPQEVDGALAESITTLLAQKDDNAEQKDKKIDNLRSELERYRPKAEAFETLVNELDTPWLRERAHIDNDSATDWLPRVTQEGLVGPTVIQSVATDVEVRGTKSGADLIGTLRDPSPDQLADQLEETISRLKQYDRLYGPSGDLRQPDDQQIAEQIDAIRTQIDQSPTPMTGMYALLDMYDDRLDTVSAQNDLERHSLAEGLDQIELAVDDAGESEQADKEIGLFTSVSQLSDEVNRLRQPGEYEIRTGHQVTGVFTEVAEQLTERARQAHEQDEPERARAFTEAAEWIYQGVKEVYSTRRLRQVLQ